jgi:hypothetical protein
MHAKSWSKRGVGKRYIKIFQQNHVLKFFGRIRVGTRDKCFKTVIFDIRRVNCRGYECNTLY